MSELIRPSLKEIEAKLTEGYQTLQKWWQDLLVFLPDPDFLKKSARINSSSSKPFNFVQILCSLPPAIAMNITYGRICDKCNIQCDDIVYAAKISHYDNRYTIQFKPADSVFKGWEKNPHPIHEMTIQAEEELNTLLRLDIRHSGLKRRTRLIKSLILLSTKKGRVQAINQTAKDESFFPRPNPRYTKSMPRQTFEFNLDEKGPQYLFNYQLNPFRRDFGTYFAVYAQMTNSFLPHPGFNLPTAIERACRFEPVNCSTPEVA